MSPTYSVFLCKPSSTLRLVKELNWGGAEAWTPVEKKRIKLPRGQGFVKKEWPALPGFIFIRHPVTFFLKDMSPMVFNGNEVKVTLHELKLMESTVITRQALQDGPKAAAFAVGDRVSIQFEAFAGRLATIAGFSSLSGGAPSISHADVIFDDSDRSVSISILLLKKE